MEARLLLAEVQVVGTMGGRGHIPVRTGALRLYAPLVPARLLMRMRGVDTVDYLSRRGGRQFIIRWSVSTTF